MMNLLALSLVATSLAVTGLWSPNPAKPTPSNGDNTVVVKEGHRTVFIEFDKDGHENTKVVISPEHDDNTNTIRKPEPVSIAEDKIASSVGHATEKAKEAVGYGDMHGAKEVICDAFGKCREKISGAMRTGRDKVEKEVQNVKERTSESVKDAKATVKNLGDDVVTNVSEMAGIAKEKAEESVRDVPGKAKRVTETVSQPLSVMSGLIRYLFPAGTFTSLMNVVNLLGFAIAYGMCMWVTFVSSNVLAEGLSRQQFGMVQSKIYPVYFRAMNFTIGMALLGHAFSHRKQLVSSKAERFQAYNLLGTLLAVLVNSAYLEPLATKVMFERTKFEKEEGRGISATARAVGTDRVAETVAAPSTIASERVGQELARPRIMKLNQRLKKLNTYSSFLNVITLLGLTWHLVYLGQRLRMTC